MKIKHYLKLKIKKIHSLSLYLMWLFGWPDTAKWSRLYFLLFWTAFYKYFVLFCLNINVKFKFQKEFFNIVWLKSAIKLQYCWVLVNFKTSYQESVCLYHLISSISPSCLVFGEYQPVFCLFGDWSISLYARVSLIYLHNFHPQRKNAAGGLCSLFKKENN